jgi:hypothetical protein
MNRLLLSDGCTDQLTHAYSDSVEAIGFELGDVGGTDAMGLDCVDVDDEVLFRYRLVPEINNSDRMNFTSTVMSSQGSEPGIVAGDPLMGNGKRKMSTSHGLDPEDTQKTTLVHYSNTLQDELGSKICVFMFSAPRDLPIGRPQSNTLRSHFSLQPHHSTSLPHPLVSLSPRPENRNQE